MRSRVPSFFVFVPGPWRDAGELVRALRERSVMADVSDSRPMQKGAVRVQLVHDRELGEAVWWSRRGPLSEELVAQIGACTAAALVECGQRLDEEPRQLAALGRALRDAGGVAVRLEASGAASDWEPWLDAFESSSIERIYEAAVLLVQDDDDVLFTCGMHHFDLPDAQIAMADGHAAAEWLDALCIYQVDEQPALASGHTFRPKPRAARRILERWPDHRHGTEDGRHNPFGVWRLLARKESAVQSGELVPVILPPLVAQLTAAERACGRPLTHGEVEALVDKSPTIAMSPREASALERARGYADLEPALAWAQWQLVRSAR